MLSRLGRHILGTEACHGLWGAVGLSQFNAAWQPAAAASAVGQTRCMSYAPFKRKTTTKAKIKRHPSRLRVATHVALCSHCGTVFAPHELLPKDKRWCSGECGIPRDLMMRQSHGNLKV